MTTPTKRPSSCGPSGIRQAQRRSSGRRAAMVGRGIALTLGAVMTCWAGERTVVEWDFGAPSAVAAWRPNGDLVDVQGADGGLRCRAVGSDPILELVAPLEFATTARQFLEIRLRASHDGTAEWFWSNTPEGRYGGFTQEKSTRFNVRGDGTWRTWRVFPFWHTEGRIVRLRFDLFDGAEFGVAHLRVGELEPAAPAETPEFTFAHSACGWRSAVGAELKTGADGLDVTLTAGDGFLLSPPLEFQAAERPFVSLALTTREGHYATLLYATDRSPGLKRFTFPLEPEPGAVTYNLDLLGAPDWYGRIIALGLQPGDQPGGQTRLAWLKAGDYPAGPPQLTIQAFAPAETLSRAGRPVSLSARITNHGGTPVTNLQITLVLPPELRIISSPSSADQPDHLDFDQDRDLNWTVTGSDAGSYTVRLDVRADNTGPREAVLNLKLEPALHRAPADYVPEPRPVRGPFEVGAYYFPGWRSAGQWQPIRGFPERRPALGWYREGSPEVADWHIKWAVEHGITYFVYDWYWSAGARQLEHALHEGYLQARYRHLLKFCLLWANHNPPGTHSQDDCIAVTRHWIEHYFRRPEHLTLDGRPAMIIFSPGRLTEDLGSEGVRQAFAAMRQECRNAGLAGLYLLACVADAADARRAEAEGYDAITAYNWAGLGLSGSDRFGPFLTLIDGYRQQWEHLRRSAGLPLLVPLSGGWDSRPWHGVNNLVRHGRTPELFRRHLVDARRFLEAQPVRSAVDRLVLIEAWNEWGEGSYIEPHQEFGFGYLEAIREVFTAASRDHTDLVPADVGLGPYDVQMDDPGRTEWTFDHDDEGWGQGMYLTDTQARDGALTAQTAGQDPAFFGPPIELRSGTFRVIELRIRLAARDGRSFTDSLQLFWRTSRLPESEATSVRVPVPADGQWHKLRLPVGDNPRWRGHITRLRLDPCSRPDIEVSLDWLRLTN